MIRTLALTSAAALTAMVMGASSFADGCSHCEDSGQTASQEATNETTAEILAVKMHADWCGTCVSLEEPFVGLQETYSEGNVGFVTMDFTNDDTTGASLATAAELGITEVIEDQAGTGFILLIDAETHEVVGRLTGSHSEDDMAEAIATALEA